MKKLIANLMTAWEVINGRFTLIKLVDNELIVVTNKTTKTDVRKVATAFFKEAYNLQ